MADQKTGASSKPEFHRMLSLGPHQVSGIWPFMLPDEFGYFQFPEERHATCLNCPKVVSEGFNPDVRCCSYMPRMPNFLIGLALENKATAPLLKKALADGFLTPEGMQQSPAQTIAALREHAEDNFGKNSSVVCPFLDRSSKLCQVYPYRNSVCSTFFCVNDGSEAGEQFWDRLQGVMGQVESVLSQWIMDQLDLPAKDYFQRFDGLSKQLDQCSDPDTGGWSKLALSQLWGHWYGREEEFFGRAADLLWEHRDHLFEIATQQAILQPVGFEQHLGETLEPGLKREYELEGKAGGTPMRPEDLWYLVEKAERDLWLLPDPGSRWVLGNNVTVVKNQGESLMDQLYRKYTHRVRVGQVDHYCGAEQAKWLSTFEQPVAITAAEVIAIEEFDARQEFCQWRHAGILVEAPEY